MLLVSPQYLNNAFKHRYWATHGGCNIILSTVLSASFQGDETMPCFTYCFFPWQQPRGSGSRSEQRGPSTANAPIWGGTWEAAEEAGVQLPAPIPHREISAFPAKGTSWRAPLSWGSAWPFADSIISSGAPESDISAHDPFFWATLISAAGLAGATSPNCVCMGSPDSSTPPTAEFLPGQCTEFLFSRKECAAHSWALGRGSPGKKKSVAGKLAWAILVGTHQHARWSWRAFASLNYGWCHRHNQSSFVRQARRHLPQKAKNSWYKLDWSGHLRWWKAAQWESTVTRHCAMQRVSLGWGAAVAGSFPSLESQWSMPNLALITHLWHLLLCPN